MKWVGGAKVQRSVRDSLRTKGSFGKFPALKVTQLMLFLTGRPQLCPKCLFGSSRSSVQRGRPELCQGSVHSAILKSI